MEILKGFVFDLQAHAAIDLATGVTTAEAWTNVTTAYIGATANKFTTNSTGAVATVTFSGAITATLGGAVDTSKVTKIVYNSDAAATDTLTVLTTGKIDIVDANGVVPITVGTATFTANSATVSDGKLTAGQKVVATAATNLDNFTGTTGNNATAYTASLSGVTGVLGDGTTANGTAGTDFITSFTKGTITTDAGFTAQAVNGVKWDNKATAAATTTDKGTTVKLTLNDRAQSVDLTTAASEFNIVGTSGADNFDGIATTAFDTTIDGGAGADNFTIGGALGVVSINGGADNDSIYSGAAAIHQSSTLLGGAGKDTINLTAITAATSDIYMDGGDGNDVILTNVTTAANFTKSTVRGGAGDDVISSSDASNLLYGGSGADTFDLSKASLTANVQDYSFAEGDMFSVTGGTDVVANGLGGKLSSDGKTGFIDSVTGANGLATVGATGNFFAVTLVDNAGKTAVGWTGETAVKLDASSQKINTVLYGTTNTEGDTLIGGVKNDTIYAGANDSIYGGAGKDSLVVGGKVGVYVGISSASGADDVSGFTAGWNIEAADAVYLVDGKASDVKVENSGTALTVKNGSASLAIAGVNANANGETDFLISGKKVAAITEGGKAVVDDSSTIADYYIGTKASQIDLTGYSGNLEVNLGNEMFRNIATLQAGSGNMSILGGKAAESLVGGAGATSLYGGAGKDTLKSGAGKTTFFGNEYIGKDAVEGFVVGTEENSDVLNVSAFKNVTRSDANTFQLNVDDSNSLAVTVASGDANSNIQWESGDAKGVAKIGVTASDNTFSYDRATTNYIGGNKKDIVSVASGSSDNFTVWLDDTGSMFSSVEGYDFSQTDGSVLAAGKADTQETIIGGQSNSSLWGGAGSGNDVLQSSGSGTTQFFYGLGDGNDLIKGTEADSVQLYNLNLSNITQAVIDGSNVVFTTNANETVTVSGGVKTFALADGTSWTADYSNKSWTQN